MDFKSINNKVQFQNHFSVQPHCEGPKRNMDIAKRVCSIQTQAEANLTQVNLQEAAERLASPNRLSIMYDPNMEWSLSAVARAVVFLVSGRAISPRTETLPLKEEQDLKTLTIENLLALREKII